MFLSLIIPTLELPLYPGNTVVYEIPVFTPPAEPKSDIPAYLDDTAFPAMESQQDEWVPDIEQTATYEQAASHSIDWAWVLGVAVWAIYFIIVALNLARFVWRLILIAKLRRHSQLTVYELYTLAVSEQVREPFSFWRTIYMNRSIASKREHNQVISHELSHIRHHHTAERIALELLRCVAWFNPFVWLAGSALVEVHEWQADSDVLSEGYDVYEYRQLIFRQLFGYNPDLTSGLSSSQTSKKRFLMMTNFKKGKYSFLRLVATLPLVAAMIFAFGAVRAEDEIVIKQPAPAVEVVDDLTPAQDSTMPIVSDDENPSTEPALISESDGDEEYNRVFSDPTALITLNHGTYVCGGYGLSHASNPAERNALRKSLAATILKVVSDTEIDVTTDDDWDIFKSGRYTYTLTRDTFTLKNKDASYSFKCEFTGPLYKATLKLIFDKQSGHFTNILFFGPTETKDKEARVSFGPNGTVYFNGEQTTIEELREKHYINFNAPIVQSDGEKEYNRKFTQATPLITLNHGTYVCVGYGLSDRVNQAETASLTKSVLATSFKVVSDTEIDVTTDAGWDFLKSGRYTYTLTRDTFTLKNKDASYSFKCEFTGPLYKATLKLIFDKQHEYFRNLIVIGPTETKDKEVRISFDPNGTVYFNGEQTTIEELREKHYMNFNAPVVQSDGTMGGNMEDVIKQNPFIYLIVGPDCFFIKNFPHSIPTQFSLAEINSVKTRAQVEKFITEKAPSTMQEFKWWNGKKWNHPVSQGIIYIDVMEGATVANVRVARDMAKSTINYLREKESVKQVNVVYGRLNEPDCATLEAAIPENIILSHRAQAVMNLSPETDVIHIVADQTPRFLGKQGGKACEAFTDWLKEQLKDNKEYQNAFKYAPEYIKPIRVIIEKDGSMSVVENYYTGLAGLGRIPNSLIAQTCAAAPKWAPAKHNGKPVRMQLDMVLHNNDNIEIAKYSFDKKIKTTKSVPRGVAVNPKQKNHNHEDDPCQYKITKVTLTDEQTVVEFNVKFWHNWWIKINSYTVLKTESKIYPIQDVKGATLDVKYWMPESGETTFQLIFPPIDCKVDKLTFDEKDWVIEDIDLSKLQPLDSKSVSAAIATPISAPKPQETPFVKISASKPQETPFVKISESKQEETPFVKTNDVIRLTVDGDKVTIKEDGNSGSISFELSNLNSGNILTILQKFITETASSRTLKLKWAGGKEWSYPASNAVIVVDAKNGASVADVRRVRDWARYAVAELRNKLSLEQVNVLYFYLCEHDCNLIELAVPTPVFITQNAQKILDLSPETDVIYSYVEQSPRFQGKQDKQAKEAFLEWMQSQKELYNEIFKNKPASYIYPAQFVIEKDGSVHLLSGLDRVLDGRIVAPEYIPLEPIEKLCAAAPKWTPAKRNGEPVRTQLTMYLSHRNDVRFGGWNSYHHSTTMSAPRGVIENPKQNANDNIKITKITFTDEQTVVDFRIWGPPTYWVRIQSNTALLTGDARYPIRDVYGTKMDTKYWIPQSGDGTFQLIFPPINCKVDKLSFFEDSWRINDIDLSSLQNSEQDKPYIPRFADGEYRPIGLIKKHSKEEIHGVIYHLPTIKVKGNKIIVEGTHYKGFIKPGEYDYRILEKDMLHLIGDGIHYITSYEYSTLSTGANMLDIMIPINVKNTQIMGVMYTRQDWED